MNQLPYKTQYDVTPVFTVMENCEKIPQNAALGTNDSSQIAHSYGAHTTLC